MSRRVLITGLSTYWGGRLAQTLERDPDTEVIVGVSPGYPTCELTRTEYVRVGTSTRCSPGSSRRRRSTR